MHGVHPQITLNPTIINKRKGRVGTSRLSIGCSLALHCYACFACLALLLLCAAPIFFPNLKGKGTRFCIFPVTIFLPFVHA